MAHAQAEHGDDLAYDLISQVGLVLLDQLWFKGTSPVSRGVQLKDS